MGEKEKTLGEMGVPLEGSGWPHGDAVVRDLLTRCHQSEALRVLDELEAHIATMGIASRFHADSYTHQLTTQKETDPAADRLDTLFGKGAKLSEGGYKRATLLLEVQRLRDKLVLTFGQLASLRLDVEAANMESDGSHVPTPSPEELEKQNVFAGAAHKKKK